jgi:beta-lactam-binding protein with PASTA domain
LNPSIPQSLDGMIKKAMEKRTDDRYQDAAELLSDLRMLQDALRFGKTLNWPIAGAPKAAAPVSAVPVEATLKKVRPDPKPVRPPREPRDVVDSDVPVWIKLSIACVGGMVFLMLAIFMYTNVQHAKTITVPRLTHLSVTEATSRLQKAGFKVGRTRTEPNDQVPADTVIATDPNAGESEYENSQVNLVVSGGSKFVEIPDLRGVTVDKAKAMLSSIDLQLDDQTSEVRDRSVQAGLIVQQNPPPRAKFERNTKVHVTVSSGRGPTRDEGDDNTKSIYRVQVTLSDIDQPVNLRVDLTDARGTKTVTEQKAQPNDVIPVSAEGYGKEVTFRIFYNNELVKQVPVQANRVDSNNTDEQP